MGERLWEDEKDAGGSGDCWDPRQLYWWCCVFSVQYPIWNVAGIRKASGSCVACYAAEGVYPPDLAYLEEHYGVQIDEERFTVSYVVFGSNLMPDITVLEQGS